MADGTTSNGANWEQQAATVIQQVVKDRSWI